jgi:hypothetical protein
VLLAGCGTPNPGGDSSTSTSSTPPPVEAFVRHAFRAEGAGKLAFHLDDYDLGGCDATDELEIRQYAADGSVHDWRGARKETLGTLVVDLPQDGVHLLLTKCVFGQVMPATAGVLVEGVEELIQSNIHPDDLVDVTYRFAWPDDVLGWEPYAGGFQSIWRVPLNYLGGYCCILEPPFQGSIELLRPDGSRYAYVESVNGQWDTMEGYPDAPFPPELTVRVSTVCCGANWTIPTVIWDGADFQAFGMQPPDRAKYATDLKVEFVPRS